VAIRRQAAGRFGRWRQRGQVSLGQGLQHGARRRLAQVPDHGRRRYWLRFSDGGCGCGRFNPSWHAIQVRSWAGAPVAQARGAGRIAGWAWCVSAAYGAAITGAARRADGAGIAARARRQFGVSQTGLRHRAAQRHIQSAPHAFARAGRAAAGIAEQQHDPDVQQRCQQQALVQRSGQGRAVEQVVKRWTLELMGMRALVR
jgi:hypothetical protein